MEEHGYSQNEVARLAGISSGHLSQIMNGQRTPSGDVVRRLHGVLFRPTAAELVVPAEVKVMAWKKGARNGVVVRGAGGPHSGSNPGGGTVRIGGRVPWGAGTTATAGSATAGWCRVRQPRPGTRAGYDSHGRVRQAPAGYDSHGRVRQPRPGTAGYDGRVPRPGTTATAGYGQPRPGTTATAYGRVRQPRPGTTATAGYDSHGRVRQPRRVSVNHVVDERGYSVMLNQRDPEGV